MDAVVRMSHLPDDVAATTRSALPGTRTADVEGAPAALADAGLLRRVQLRDELALEALYDRYGGLVYTLARRIVGDCHLAEEVVQDTFIRCWGGAVQYDAARGRLSSWLLGVARNRAIDVLRGRQHQARLHERASLAPDAARDDRSDDRSDDPVAWGPAPSYQAADDAVLRRHTVTCALAGLPLAQRQALVLAYFGGLTQAEIACALRIPLGTVKTRTRNGLEQLRLALGPPRETADGPDGRW